MKTDRKTSEKWEKTLEKTKKHLFTLIEIEPTQSQMEKPTENCSPKLQKQIKIENLFRFAIFLFHFISFLVKDIRKKI